MTVERWNHIKNYGGWGDLSARAKWLLKGEDRVRYLNGQVTNDVRRATVAAAVYTCVTDHKGRICGDAFIRATNCGEGLLLDAEPTLRELLGSRLERYIVADDVECLDVTDDWRLVHGFGPGGRPVIDAGVTAERFGMSGQDLWLGVEDKWAGAPELKLTEDELEIWRVVQGIPKYPNELNEGVFPPEAGLEIKAVDYTKGCYIGQEVISRMRTTGKMPRRLIRWHAEEGTGLIVAGDLVYEEGGAVDGKSMGHVTSVVRHPESGRMCGLAYVKQAVVPLHSRLLVGVGMGNIEVNR